MHKNTLFKYSTAASAFLSFANETDAQIVYTDLDPDLFLYSYPGLYADYDYLDINSDSIQDFYLLADYSSWCGVCADGAHAYIIPLSSNAVAYNLDTVLDCDSDSNVFVTVNYVPEGDTIGDEVFINDKAYFFFDDATYGSLCAFSLAGNHTVNLQFIPIQLNIDGAIHYGWLRYTIEYNELYIYDYAYNATPGEYLKAGVPVNTIAILEYADDVSDNVNGTDLAFAFQKAEYEDNISEYRVIVMKTSEPELTIGEALSLDSERYIAITPDGSTLYEENFLGGSKDSNGDLITNNITYRLYVLSYATVDSGAAHTLSLPSEDVMLQTSIAAFTSLTFEDIANNGNAADIHLKFSASETEEVISEYRIILSEEDSLSADELASILPENYLVHIPDDSSFDQVLSPDMKDINGELITYAREYYAYILMVDNGLGTGNIFVKSNSLVLNGPTGIASNLQLFDEGDAGDATDLTLTFSKAEDESTVQQYRVMLVPTSFVPLFDIYYVMDLTEPKYVTLEPAGEDIVITFPVTARDVEGNIIVEGIEYKAFVFSVPSPSGSNPKLSEPSNSITLDGALFMNGVPNQTITMFYENNQFQIILPEIPASNYRLELYLTDGRKVFEKEITELKTTFSIDMSQGIYIAILYTETQAFSQKIVVK